MEREQSFREVSEEIFAHEALLIGAKPDTLDSVREKLSKPYYPSLIQVGISNVCNLNCKQCYYPIYSNSPSYRRHFMSEDVLERIVTEIKTFPNEPILRFLGRGESLLHPKLTDMIKYAKANTSGKIVLITNGHLLNENCIGNLLESGVDAIDISLDAITQKSYEKIRSGSLSLVENNLRQLIQMRNFGNYKTKIITSFLIQPENYFEAKEFRLKWTGVVDKPIFRSYHSYGGKITEKISLEDTRYPCAALWTRVNINEMGKITLCYIDWNETAVLGDLNENGASILGIWKTAYDQYRKMHIEGNYPKLCANCNTGWQAAHWNLNYETLINDKK